MFDYRAVTSPIHAEQTQLELMRQGPPSRAPQKVELVRLMRRGRHDLAAMDTESLLEARDECVRLLEDRTVPYGARAKLAEDHDHILDVLEARQDLGDPLLSN